VRAADGPFGTTIAHGFLTLSVVPVLLAEVLEIGKLAAFVNYGTDKVRFLRPVPVGSRVQAAVTLQSVEDSAMGVRAVLSVEVRLDDGGKPACVAELITVLVGE
jgi:acyl dehydratase